MKDYTKYYTPKNVAEILIQNCLYISPRTVIDICAGSWNLLHEAKKKWPYISMTGVDIQFSNKKSRLQDGRLFAAEAFKKNIKYDLVLANPPFEYETIEGMVLDEYKKIFSEHNFNGNIMNRLESTMLLFNSLLVEDGGLMASIVPNSTIKGKNQISLRKYLSGKFHVEKIISLPESAFGSSGISTSIIILRKTHSTESTVSESIVLCNNEFKVVKNGNIPNAKIKEGIWQVHSKPEIVRLAGPLEILRNNISTKNFSGIPTDYPVIHTSSISDQMIDHTKLKYISELNDYYHRTLVGDIVIVRVGKKYGAFSLITDKDKDIFVSDCLMILRPYNQVDREIVLSSLENFDFTQLVKGVATKYITKHDIEELFSI